MSHVGAVTKVVARMRGHDLEVTGVVRVTAASMTGTAVIPGRAGR